MDKLIFVYDKLMTAKEQALSSLDLEFIAFGQMRGKLYFLNDDKKRRIFALPSKGNSTKLVYGGIFLLKNYEEKQYKIHAYYNNSIAFTGETFIEDLFDMKEITVTPIKFVNLRQIEKNEYIKGEPVKCNCFIGNLSNYKIQHSKKRGRYYRIQNVDAESFVQMIKDRSNCNE